MTITAHPRRILALLAAALLLPAFCAAQSIENISFVPLKTGVYRDISTKTLTRLAQRAGSVSANQFYANSSWLYLDTLRLTASRPVYVRNNAYIQPGTRVSVTTLTLYTGGRLFAHNAGERLSSVDAEFDLDYSVQLTNLSPVTMIKATNVNLKNNSPYLPAGTPVYMGEVTLNAPPSGCAVAWKGPYNALPEGGSSTISVYVLGCQ